MIRDDPSRMIAKIEIVQIQNGWILTMQTKVTAASMYFPTLRSAIQYIAKVGLSKAGENE